MGRQCNKKLVASKLQHLSFSPLPIHVELFWCMWSKAVPISNLHSLALSVQPNSIKETTHRVTLFLIELLGCIFISSLRLFRLLKLLWLKHTGQNCKTLPLPSPRLLVCRLATSARFIFLWCLEQKGTTPILSYNIPTFFGIICYIRCVAWYMRWYKISLYIWKNSPNKNVTYLTGQNCYQLVAIALCMEH